MGCFYMQPTIRFVFDLVSALEIDIEKSHKYFYFIYLIQLYINRPHVHFNRSITFKGGRFPDIGIFLKTKKGVARKQPPPPPNELRLRHFLGDTRYLILQLGDKKTCLPLVVPGSAIY